MYAIIDSLIFPAPNSYYTQESLKGKLIYVPRFSKDDPSRPSAVTKAHNEKVSGNRSMSQIPLRNRTLTVSNNQWQS